MNCKICRRQLVDIAYGEARMTPALEEHLTACPQCALYQARLQEEQAMLGAVTFPDESGFREVKAALREARRVTGKRRLLSDLAKFAAIIVMVLSLYYLIYHWQGLKGFAVFYLAMYSILPLSWFPLQKWVVKKEESE